VTGGCVVGGVRGAAEDVGWDNLLLKVSTNSVGNVISVAGFNVDDYRVFGVTRCGDNTDGTGTYAATCNSWSSGYFSAVRVAPTAIDDGPYSANEGVALPIDVMANDTAFVDNVTVTVTTLPTKGTAIVSGSPGPQAGILITYTANIGAVGDDSFVYTVLDADGVTSDAATVTLAVGLGAKSDTAVTTRNQPVNINVGANDTGFGNDVTVSVDGGSFSAGGSASVTAGNNGPPGGIVVTYTPVSAVNSPAYTETFSYTIDDGVQPPDTATVTVTVNNQVPDAPDGSISIDTAGATPVGQTGVYTVPGAGLGDTPSVVSISVQGTRGTAAVAGTTITYTVTDPTFVSGSDTLTYTITDREGDNDSGVLIVLAGVSSPTITTSYIVTGQGKASVPLEPGITLGNGTAAEHTLVVTDQASDGSCVVTPGDATGKIVYTPASDDFVGNDSCEVTLTDADGDAVTGAVNIKVTARSGVGGGGALDLWSLLLLGATGLRRFRRRASGTIALLIALVGASFSAWGQASDEPVPAKARSSAAIQEIVVTARKVEENLQEVPLAITAFDSNSIETKGITSLADVAALTPGLSFFNAFGENLPVPVIRGIAPTDIFGQNNAAIFVDGVYISGREGLNFSQLDIERIEVVKGPQSALYGRNAFSGAINYVTKPPSEEFEAKTVFEVGNDGKIKAQGGMSGPILGENLRGRIGLLYDDWDGSYDNAIAPQNDLGGYRFRSFQGALLWLPADDWEVNLSYYNSNDDIDESASVALPTNCEDRVNDNNGTERLQNFCGELPENIESVPGLNGNDAIPKVAQATGENRELDRANLRIAWDLQETGTLSALTGYSKVKQNSVSDFSRSLGENTRFLYCGGAANTPGIPNSCNEPADNNFFTGIYDRELGAESEELSQELRFTSSQDQAFRYTAGGYWYQVDEKAYPGGTIATNQVLPDGGAIAFPPFEGNLAVGTAIFYETFTPDGGLDPLGRKVSDDNTEGWALFTGMDFDITDQLIARAELRYSQEAQEINNLRYNKCYTSATTSGVLGGCVYPDDVLALTGDDKYDLRQIAAVPLFGPDCQFTSLEGPVRPGTPGQCSNSGSARFESVTGRVGLDFKINSDWMVYGSIAYGEKPGGLQLASGNQILPGGDVETVVINSTFDPEELTAYELGVKGAAFDGRLTISTAVFYNDWKEIVLRQLTETNPDNGLTLEQPVGLNVNAGDADVWGFEIEANAGFTENLTGRFTLGWADAELDNASQDVFETFPTFAPDGDVSGNKLLRQPEWLISGSLDYQRILVDDWEWYAGTDVNYQSSVYVGNDNQSWLPEHTYVNTRLGVRNGQYTVEFWTRNLFDDGNPVAAFRDIYWANTDNQYPPYVSQGDRPDFDEFVPLRYTVTYPRERTFGLNVQMRFGAAVR
jgi:outer membrane receptor protein involved in Fe transport